MQQTLEAKKKNLREKKLTFLIIKFKLTHKLAKNNDLWYLEIWNDGASFQKFSYVGCSFDLLLNNPSWMKPLKMLFCLNLLENVILNKINHSLSKNTQNWFFYVFFSEKCQNFKKNKITMFDSKINQVP